jgi:hypothetical protein
MYQIDLPANNSTWDSGGVGHRSHLGVGISCGHGRWGNSGTTHGGGGGEKGLRCVLISLSLDHICFWKLFNYKIIKIKV